MKKETEKIIYKFIAVFCIILIVSTPFYMMDVSAQPPEINVELPRYYNENEIDITGTTAPYSTVRLYVNDMVVPRRVLSSSETGENGIINFQRVALAAQNNIRIWVQNQAGETNTRDYEITVDTQNPQIDLEELPFLIGEKTLTVKGIVNENVTINFYLDSGVIDNEPPAKITGLVAVEIDKNSIEIEWDENEDSDFAKYVVYREDVGPIAITKPANYNTYNDALVNSNTAYTYRVSAIDKSGNEGLKSDPLTVTTLDGGARNRNPPKKIDIKAERQAEESIETKDNFEVTLEPREEGSYTLTIEVIDLAQNMITVQHEFILDTTPPEIIDIIPRSGSLIYENFADRVDIEGHTDPVTDIKLYINKSGIEQEEYSEKSNSEGYFKFRNVDLTRAFGGAGLHEVPPEQLGNYYPGEFPTTARTAEVVLKATDSLGRTAKENVKYRIGTCWSGNLTWDVRLFPEYQSPTLLSTERIAEGTETIYFMLNFTYTREGSGKIKSLTLSRACDDYIRDDPKYNWSCRIMPSGCRTEHSPDYTAWFVSCPLGAMDEMNRWLEDDWKGFFKAINGEMVFPFRLRIGYTYKVDERESSEHQSTCIPITYVVDNTKINFKDTLPDWLLYDTADWLNKTINTLDDVQNFLRDKIELIGMFCIGSFLFKFLVKIYRKYTCYMDAFSYPQRNPAGIFKGWNLVAQKERDKLSNEELAEALPSCKAAWDFESKIYIAYRAFCDRVFCHGAPARWTAEAGDSELTQRIEEEKKCDTTSSELGQPLRKVKCRSMWDTYNKHMREEKREDVPIDKECFEVWKRDGKETLRYLYTFDDNQDLSSRGVYKLTPYEDRPSKETLYVIKQNDDNYLTKRYDSCQEVCDERGYNMHAECMDVSFCKERIDGDGYVANHYGFTNDCYYDSGEDINVIVGDNTQRQECCCVKESKTDEVKYYTVDDKSLTGGNAFSGDEILESGYPEFSYRYYSTEFKTAEGHNQYNPYRYVEGRDITACFAQNNWLDKITEPLGMKQTLYLDPFKSHWPAVQCACLSGVYNRITALKNMMAAMQGCLIQIRTTGTADAGVCKEVFSQYVCSLFWRLISFFEDDCLPWESTDPAKEDEKQEANIGTYAKAGSTALWETISESGDDIGRDYGNVELTNLLGYGQEAVARKICLAAFGFDWDLEGMDILDVAYSVPYMTLVQPVTKTREYLTFDPSRGKGTAKYEYRASWIINPGCEIDDYDVYLTCVTRDEMNRYTGINCNKQEDPEGINCDCLDSNLGGGISYQFFDGRRLAQGSVEDKAKNEVVTSQYRYDHLKFVLRPSRRIQNRELKENCFPEGHYNPDRDEATFYFPIRDKTAYDIAACNVDTLTGEFTCPQGRFFWGAEMNGQIIWSQTRINDKVAQDGIMLYAGKDDLTVEPTVWKVQGGADMCLYINVYSGSGTPEKSTVRPVTVPGTYQLPKETLIKAGELKPGGIKVSFPNGIEGDLEPETYIINYPFEFNIGFRDVGSNGIILKQDSEDEVMVGGGAYKKISYYSNNPGVVSILSDGLLIASERNNEIAKVKITGVQIPVMTPPTNEVNGKITISQSSQSQMSGEKKVEFMLTNLLSGVSVYEDEQSCNKYDIVKYRGEEQKKSFRIEIRVYTEATKEKLKAARDLLKNIIGEIKEFETEKENSENYKIPDVYKTDFLNLLNGAETDIENAIKDYDSQELRNSHIDEAAKKINKVLKDIYIIHVDGEGLKYSLADNVMDKLSRSPASSEIKYKYLWDVREFVINVIIPAIKQAYSEPELSVQIKPANKLKELVDTAIQEKEKKEDNIKKVIAKLDELTPIILDLNIKELTDKWNELIKNLKGEPIPPISVIRIKEIQEMIDEKMSILRPDGKYGDFRNFIIPNQVAIEAGIPGSIIEKEQIKNVIISELGKKGYTSDNIDLIRGCYFEKVLKQESNYKQFKVNQNGDYHLVASDVPGNNASGCCVGIGQINVIHRDKYDLYSFVVDSTYNVQKGIDIFLDCLNIEDGWLDSAASCYKSGPKGTATYDDHCSHTQVSSIIV